MPDIRRTQRETVDAIDEDPPSAAAEGKKKKANMRWLNDCLDRAARVLRDIVPFEHPKLAAVKLGGDPDAPLNLSGLTDAELAYFRRIMVKIGATTGPADA